jgi:catechol 2,3-dioxygenase-like lactoylglutathione lyase family enzyme
VHAKPGITHVEIGVSDVSRSMDFYQGLLGFRPAHSDPAPAGPGVHWLAAGPAFLKLVEVGRGGSLGGWVNDDLQRGMRHVGMKVGDVPLQAEKLRDAGVKFTIEPTEAVGDVRLAFFTDPDGTLLEIIDGHLHYHETWSSELANREREAAERRPREAGPSFDHVAVTVADLDDTLCFYSETMGYEVIGQLRHTEDPRGFLITYLQAGGVVLELFAYTAEVTENPWTPDPSRLGFRRIGLGTDDTDAAVDRMRSAGAREVSGASGSQPLLVDADGIPLEVGAK